MNRVSVLLPILLAFIVWAQANIDAPARSNFQGITKYYHPQPPPPPPPRCSGKDEEYYRELPFCNVYCEDIGKPCIPPTKPNNAGCGCRSGFSRWRPTGQCISHRDCAKKRCEKSGPNEIYKYCGEAKPKSCEPICGLNDNRPCHIQNEPYAKQNTPIRCEEGCRCEAGYKINPQTGLCVHSHACPHPTIPCRADEEWRNWNRQDEACLKTKEDKGKPPNTYNCYCKRDHFRFNGNCIHKLYCGRL